MAQIKSEKAISFIKDRLSNVTDMLSENAVLELELCMIEAAGIAETDAEERHAKELEALKEKVAEAFDSIIGATNFYNSNNDNFWDLKEQFVQRLNNKIK